MSKKELTLDLPVEHVLDLALLEMRSAHAAGHAIAAWDALLFSKQRNLEVPDWASEAILKNDYATEKRKGQKPAHRQYSQYMKEAVRFLAVRCCEDKREERLRGEDKFERACKILKGHWASTKDSSGVRNSFYKFRSGKFKLKHSARFYLSYIAYRCDPEYFAFLYRAVNRNNLIPALFDLAKRTQK